MSKYVYRDFLTFDEGLSLQKLWLDVVTTPFEDEVRLFLEGGLYLLKRYTGAAWVEIGGLGELLPADVALTGTESTMAVDLGFGDNKKSCQGNSKDLTQYHDGMDSNIENDTGDLNVINNAADEAINFKVQNAGGQNTVLAIAGDTESANIKSIVISGRPPAALASATHYDDYDVTGISHININSTSNDVTLGGFSNGVTGQVIYITKATGANNLVIEHQESSGTQKFLCPAGIDLTLGSYSGATIMFTGTSWSFVGLT